MEKKMKIIAIANQKGGVGKTTTAVSLASSFQHAGHKTLCIDFDHQRNLGKYLGHTPDSKPTISDFVIAQASYEPMPETDGLIRRAACGLDYIPCSLRLARADMALAMSMFRERVLDTVLKNILANTDYEYVVIDCNPSMGILLQNVMAAADYLLIPVQTEDFAMEGLEDMLELLHIVHDNINPRLQLLGILPTMQTHTLASRDVVKWLKESYGGMVLEHGTFRSVEAVKSVRRKEPLAKGRSKLADEYRAAADEVLKRLEETK